MYAGFGNIELIIIKQEAQNADKKFVSDSRSKPELQMM